MVHPLERAQWRAWLEANQAAAKGIWVASYKLSAGKARLTYDEIVEEALCFGWIDSKGGKLDEERTLLWMAPRKPKSAWSRLNKERIERLTAGGMMAPSGQRMVDLAKESGTWSALDAVEMLTLPDDLQAAFECNRGSAAKWEAFSRSARRAILEWIANARRPETRAQRIDETARLAAKGQAANQWRPRAKA
ncbi:MAG: hypothetical protein GEU75_03120 [Dehalococcoidia bacterium]|nr:hypothetical protein [Dehalococcoidia bacterium]